MQTKQKLQAGSKMAPKKLAKKFAKMVSEQTMAGATYEGQLRAPMQYKYMSSTTSTTQAGSTYSSWPRS